MAGVNKTNTLDVTLPCLQVLITLHKEDLYNSPTVQTVPVIKYQMNTVKHSIIKQLQKEGDVFTYIASICNNWRQKQYSSVNGVLQFNVFYGVGCSIKG